MLWGWRIRVCLSFNHEHLELVKLKSHAQHMWLRWRTSSYVLSM